MDAVGEHQPPFTEDASQHEGIKIGAILAREFGIHPVEARHVIWPQVGRRAHSRQNDRNVASPQLVKHRHHVRAGLGHGNLAQNVVPA